MFSIKPIATKSFDNKTSLFENSLGAQTNTNTLASEVQEQKIETDYFSQLKPEEIGIIQSLKEMAQKNDKIDYFQWNGTSVSTTLFALLHLKNYNQQANYQTICWAERALFGFKNHLKANHLMLDPQCYSSTLATQQLKTFKPSTFVDDSYTESMNPLKFCTIL
jgi:hypothetical protein